MKQKTDKYVPNNVFTFRINCNIDLAPIQVFTDPSINDEDEVQAAYFTEEKLNEIRERFIDIIKNWKKPPFNIYCIDMDSDYKVTADDIFKI